MSKTYAEKLKSPLWQRCRLEIMQRDGFQCVCCGSAKEQLSVHHVLYSKGRDPWDYPPEELVTVCGSCHTSLEVWRDDILRELHRITFGTLKPDVACASVSSLLRRGFVCVSCGLVAFDEGGRNGKREFICVPCVDEMEVSR